MDHQIIADAFDEKFDLKKFNEFCKENGIPPFSEAYVRLLNLTLKKINEK